jgi:hypothetical protein
MPQDTVTDPIFAAIEAHRHAAKRVERAFCERVDLEATLLEELRQGRWMSSEVECRAAHDAASHHLARPRCSNVPGRFNLLSPIGHY